LAAFRRAGVESRCAPFRKREVEAVGLPSGKRKRGDSPPLSHAVGEVGVRARSSRWLHGWGRRCVIGVPYLFPGAVFLAALSGGPEGSAFQT